MGFDDGPDSLALGIVQALRGEAEACGKLSLAANPLLEPVVGFHCSRLTMCPVAVQQTGRLMAALCSDATRSPEPDRHQRTTLSLRPSVRPSTVSGPSWTRRDNDEPERKGVQIHGRSLLRGGWLRRLCAGLWLIRAVESGQGNRRASDHDNRWDLLDLTGSPRTGGLFSTSFPWVMTSPAA
jgi:hypothetical protein